MTIAASIEIRGRLAETGQPARVELREGRISAIDIVTDAPQRWLAPGFVDAQVNGYGGFDVNAADPSAEQVSAMVESLWRQGVTSLCPTVVTQSEEQMCRCLQAIAHAAGRSALMAHTLPMAHVEGPYLSPEDGPRGAHAREHIRPASTTEYERWQRAAAGRVGIVTLAPEAPGALEYIRALSAQGTLVGIGHTAASPDLIREAANAGARLSTHLGNGCSAVLPRLDNHIWAQLADDRLWASLIFDGHHLPPEVMKVMLRAKSLRRALLVSDSVALAGAAPGIYDTPVGGKVELAADGRLSLAGSGYLAGSASPLTTGLRNAMVHGGVSLAHAVKLTSTNPARLLGLSGPPGRGTLRAGAIADVVVLSLNERTKELTVEMTVVSGSIVYRRK
jgi:N-acetylglucosamine-6-phosphate deacetylase